MIQIVISIWNQQILPQIQTKGTYLQNKNLFPPLSLGSLTPSTEDFYREDPPIKPQMVPPTAAPRSIKPPLPTSSSTSGSSESLSSTSSPDPQKLEYQFETGKGSTDYQLEPSAILSEAAAASAASQAVMAAAAAKFGLETGKGNNTTSSSSSSTTSSRQRGKILWYKISVKLILDFCLLKMVK